MVRHPTVDYVLNVMKGNSEKAYNILKSGNFAYFNILKLRSY